jgi:uncharacterized SAM-binding protein YcdF (DUF218 family)
MLREILPLFLMPTCVVLALLVVALRTRRRWPIIVALVLLWAASTPVVSNVLMRAVEGWRVRQVTSDAPNADAIVVLSLSIRDVPGDATSFEFDDFDRFLGGAISSDLLLKRILQHLVLAPRLQALVDCGK